MPMFPLGILKQQTADAFTATVTQTLTMLTQTLAGVVPGTYSGTVAQTLPMIVQALTDITSWDPIGELFTCTPSIPSAVAPTGQTFSC